MIVHEIHDLSNDYVVELLKEGIANTVRVKNDADMRNYHFDSRDSGANIFHRLKRGVYKDGCYYVLEEDGEFKGCGGWNPYKDDIALALTRAYIPPKYRHQWYLAKHILPRIIDATVSYDHLWMTVNSYNKKLYDWISRNNSTKTIGILPDIYSKFSPLGRTLIYNTSQYVLEYERD